MQEDGEAWGTVGELGRKGDMKTEQLMLVEEWPPRGEELSLHLTEHVAIPAPLLQKEARPREGRSLAEGHTAMKGVP